MPASLKESLQRWWLALLLVAGMIFSYAQRGTLSIGVPTIMKELGLSRTVMGVLLSSFNWSYSFLQMPAGCTQLLHRRWPAPRIQLPVGST